MPGRLPGGAGQEGSCEGPHQGTLFLLLSESYLPQAQSCCQFYKQYQRSIACEGFLRGKVVPYSRNVNKIASVGIITVLFLAVMRHWAMLFFFFFGCAAWHAGS